MASNRHLGRIVALQTLYEYDFRSTGEQPLELTDVLERNVKQFSDTIDDVAFVTDIVRGVADNTDDLDKRIAPVAPEWPVEQIARIDKTILRIAIYEMLIKKKVPPKVVINEAVELAKSFGGDNASKFVNGVLGTLYRQEHGESSEDKSGPDKKNDKQKSTKNNGKESREQPK